MKTWNIWKYIYNTYKYIRIIVSIESTKIFETDHSFEIKKNRYISSSIVNELAFLIIYLDANIIMINCCLLTIVIWKNKLCEDFPRHILYSGISYFQTISMVEVVPGVLVAEPKLLKTVPWEFQVMSPFERSSESPSWVVFSPEVRLFFFCEFRLRIYLMKITTLSLLYIAYS